MSTNPIPNASQSTIPHARHQDLSQGLRILDSTSAQHIVEAALPFSNDTDLQRPSPELQTQIDGAQTQSQAIALHFPKFTDGRAFSQAVLLRRRFGFQGDIIATGEVLLDQLAQMARCGFTVAVLREGLDSTAAHRILNHYPAYYQADDARELQPSA
jgi:uncharacterized protein (DUF934 family)